MIFYTKPTYRGTCRLSESVSLEGPETLLAPSANQSIVAGHALNLTRGRAADHPIKYTGWVWFGRSVSGNACTDDSPTSTTPAFREPIRKLQF